MHIIALGNGIHLPGNVGMLVLRGTKFARGQVAGVPGVGISEPGCPCVKNEGGGVASRVRMCEQMGLPMRAVRGKQRKIIAQISVVYSVDMYIMRVSLVFS